ncbi:putative ABC transporter-binding protein [Rubrobacter xylanophilus DSM 9941]|uniref:ABC transporter substrate-binding protein n=1 Tax=Rubrobacter xylanophilus TaxID=49319 RepID=UPI001C642939|nr:ABC transporter substrate-binding protein [Rubrobacter xylanophilus]QYJ15130.1 putative ABC transporter-binding protein [Rubrobacter xylanophilus DSM 9941]
MTERRRAEKTGGVLRRRLGRREFLRLGGASLAGAALLGAAACGGGGGGPQRAEDGSILFNFSFGPDPSGTLQELVRRFNERYAGEYKANWREMPAQTEQYFDRLRTQFQAGGGDIALIGGDVIWPAQFAANGWIADLSDRFPESERRKFLDGPIEANTYEGKIYGVPWFTDAGMLYYRRDLLQKSGFSEPPKTWEELKEMALRVKQDSGTRDGFVFQGADYEGGVVDGLEYIWTHGGDVLDPQDSTRVVIDSPESVAGLKTERSMIEDGVAPEAVVNYAEMESHTAFLNGDAVFMRNWPYVYALSSDPKQSKIKPEQIDIARLPAAEGQESVSGLGGWNFYINAAMDEETQNAAWEFVKFATAPEQQKFRALEGSFLPTLKELYEDREILDQVPVIALGREAILSTRPRPVSPYYSDMSLRMAEQFNASLKGEVSPEEAISTLQEELQNIVEQGS